MCKQVRQKGRKEEPEAERQRERVYLQGRGGGTPKSAKSGSEEREEEGGGEFIFNTWLQSQDPHKGKNKQV